MATPSRTGQLVETSAASSTTVYAARRWWVLAACCTVAFTKLAAPEFWMIGIEIPASAFNTLWREYRLYADFGLVLFISFQLIGGLLGDMFGRREVLLIGAIGSVVANLLSLVAWSMPALIVFRGLEGLMGALAFPLTLAVVRLVFAAEERKIALLIYAFVTAVGTLASLLAIPIESWFGWRWALVLPLAAGAVGVHLAWRHIPASRAQGGVGRVEAVAAAGWSLVILALLFGFVVARTTGTWRNPTSLAAGAAGVAGLLGMLLWARRTAHPGLLQGADYVPRHFLFMMLLVTATLSFALSGYVLQLYQFFFSVQQYPAVLSGVALTPMVVGNLFTMRWAGRFAIEQPPHIVVGSGLGAMGVAMLLTTLAHPNLPYLLLVPMMVLFGLGFLVASAAWNYFFFSVLPADLTGLSAGINRAAGLAGGALAGVILSAVVVVTGMANFQARLADLGLAAEQQAGALEAVEALLRSGLSSDELAQLPGALVTLGLMSAYREARSVAVSSALLVGSVICLSCAFVAWLWLRAAETRRLAAAQLATAEPAETTVG